MSIRHTMHVWAAFYKNVNIYSFLKWSSQNKIDIKQTIHLQIFEIPYDNNVFKP